MYIYMYTFHLSCGKPLLLESDWLTVDSLSSSVATSIDINQQMIYIYIHTCTSLIPAH